MEVSFATEKEDNSGASHDSVRLSTSDLSVSTMKKPVRKIFNSQSIGSSTYLQVPGKDENKIKLVNGTRKLDGKLRSGKIHTCLHEALCLLRQVSNTLTSAKTDKVNESIIELIAKCQGECEGMLTELKSTGLSRPKAEATETQQSSICSSVSPDTGKNISSQNPSKMAGLIDTFTLNESWKANSASSTKQLDKPKPKTVETTREKRINFGHRAATPAYASMQVRKRGANEIEAPSLRVLVVNHNESDLATVVRALGDTYVSVRDGVEAREVMRESRESFDVVIIGQLESADLCRTRRDSRDDWTFFILVVDQSDTGRNRITGSQAGVDDYLVTPASSEAIAFRLLAARRALYTRRKLLRDSQRNFQLAHVDQVTGTSNRLTLIEDLKSLNRCGSRSVVAMCDVDHFKEFNDAYGHLQGDAVLRQVADTMQRALGFNNRLYRYGGDEFVILMHEQPLEIARCVMERVRTAVESTGITISVGIADMLPDVDYREILHRADAALYRAKELGRNRIQD